MIATCDFVVMACSTLPLVREFIYLSVVWQVSPPSILRLVIVVELFLLQCIRHQFLS